MTMQSLSGIGYGGAAGNRLNLILQELQSRKSEVVNGAAAAAAITISGMEEDSTIKSVIMYAAGVPSDVTAEASCVDRRATGTLTLTGLVAGDVVGVNGKNYTAIANPGIYQNLTPRQFVVGATDTLTAVNLAAAINSQDTDLTATSATTVVTLRARVRGTGGNSLALVVTGSNSHAARSAATLAGGTATGGFRLSTTNSTGNKLVIDWMAKPSTPV
jgi:hypothetical protein